MVQIDVMLLYSGKNYDLNSGFEAGLSSEKVKTEGTIFPGLDMKLGFGTINTILNAINGFGVVNLGQVSENFYMSLNLLESNSIIEIESTPKISTLNGHVAKLSIGETTYYQEQQLSFQPINQNAGFQQSSKVWKNLDANLSVTIKPFVSADEYVTLTITVKQEDFGGRVDPTAPPNLSNQNFESVIRVKNGEVILLGGLEKKSINDSGKGTPVLSRIPILKWFFSSRKKLKNIWNPKKVVVVFMENTGTAFELKAVSVHSKKGSQPVESFASLDELTARYGKYAAYWIHIDGTGVLTRIADPHSDYKKDLLMNVDPDDFFFTTTHSEG
ncbi:bacterial type II and III secretion system protein, partial [Ancylostoma ceylanicum]